MSTLSTLIPVYNAAPFLTEALDSLLIQSRPADQIVIINDGSTDGSRGILEKYAKREARIELYNVPNGGVSRARNLGLQYCQGDYIALMDADDRSLPERFTRQLDAMQALQLDVCGCALQTFGRKTRTVVYPGDDASLKSNYLFYGRTIPGPAAMLRRSSIEHVRFEEGLRFAEDFGFFLAMILQSPQVRLHNLQQPLYAYRTHASQASQRLVAENQANLSCLLRTWLPVAGITCTDEQLTGHYTLWQEQRPLSPEQLKGYLPLMEQLCSWLSEQINNAALAQSLWKRLARLHASSSAAQASITMQSGVRLSTWERLTANFRRA